MREKLDEMVAVFTVYALMAVQMGRKADIMLGRFALRALDKVGLRDTVETIAHGGTVWFDTKSMGRLPIGLIGFKADTRGQLGFRTIVAAVSVLVVTLIAIVIADNLDQSLGTPQSSDLSTAQTDVLGGFGDMAGLIGPLFIVAVATVIIMQIQRMQG
jgi:hypothetical protein